MQSETTFPVSSPTPSTLRKALVAPRLLRGPAFMLLLLTVACTPEEAPPVEGESNEAGSQERPQLKGTRVEVVVMSTSDGGLSLRVPGEVEGARDAELAAPMGGYIENVSVREGQRVKKGAVLARVDSRTYSTRLVRAQVEKKAAERELSRSESLGASIPAAELDSGRDRVASADAALRELQLAASRSVITAPFSGVIVSVEAEVGEVASPGLPLFRLVQLQPVRVSIALSDRDITLAQVGMSAQVETAASAGLVSGKVVQLSQAANLKTRSFEALIEVANDDEKLLPGMIAQVSLSTVNKGDSLAEDAKLETSNKLLISQDWLVTKPNIVGVFIVEDGKAAFKEVQLGEVMRRQVEVLDGLRAGDKLIIVGHRALAEGDPVLVHRQGTCCKNGRAVFGDGDQ